ncbi:MAG: hypothetical protein ACREEN_00495 [Stellaceae bacterium]
MTTRSKVYAGQSLEHFYDDANGEILELLRRVRLDEDFTGTTANVIGGKWSSKVVKTAGSPTVAGVANKHQVACTLDATSEKQDAVLYFADNVCLDLMKQPIVDINAAATVLPSGTGDEVVFGLMAAWIDGPDNNTGFARFKCSGSGELYAELYDGTTLTTVDTGILLVAGVFHDFQIDAWDSTNVLFYVDGARVCASSTFAIGSSVTTLGVQPYVAAYKPSGTGVATVTVDCIKIGQNR